ncbi:MAG: patatin-like phospholipase family protein, partial [Bacteroidales bacterium]|nr:patatin-like phospholipase family protein [Bacteroidales bacterium]
ADLVTGKSKNWTGGDVALAMRATMSIPGLFNPVRSGNMVLVDGGIRNNFPTDLARAMGADIVIGVVLSQVVESEIRVENIGNIISRLIDMLSREAYKKSIMEADVCIHPDLHEYNMLSFNSEAIDTILHRGYQAALDCEDMLSLVATRTAGRKAVERKAPAKDLSAAQVRISDISFPGKSEKDASYLLEKIGVAPGDSVGKADLDNAVSVIFATGSFKDVSYSLLEDGDGSCRLQFNLTDGPVHRIGISGRADTEDMVAGLVEFSYNAYRLSGSKFDFEARIGQNWYGMARWSLTSPHLPALGVSLRSGKNMANMIIDGAFCDAGFWHHRADVSLSGFHSASFDLAAGARYDYYGLNSWLSEKSFDDRVRTIDDMTTYRRGFFTAYGGARAYTLDDKYFPTRGLSLGVGYEWVLGNDLSQIITLDYRSPIRFGRAITLIPSLYVRYVVSESTTIEDNMFVANFAGGAMQGRYFDQQMPFDGFHRCVMLDDFAVDFQLDLRVNPWKNLFLSLKGGAIESASEVSGLFGEEASFIVGGAFEAAYKAIFGPVKFDLQYSRPFGLGAYFSIGYDF